MSVSRRIAVCGLGYVGLPVAVAFGRQGHVVGFDIDVYRVAALAEGHDWTGQMTAEDLAQPGLSFTADPAAMRGCDVFIVAVPTPVDAACAPDFSMLVAACKTIGPVLAPGAIVVFESTVYPGATEDICGPALAAASGLRAGIDFKLAYSPERINPGDKDHPLEKIVKVVSAQDDETCAVVADLYGAIVEAGVFRAPSIKVAEAAKVLENTQRDINIALMNEMSKICDLVGIRTKDVLEAAGTKWNFLRFTPGLVGGHCIGVDPYYLTSKAQQLGYHAEVILAGRRINDGMGDHVAARMMQILAQKGLLGQNPRVGIMGITFKPDISDIRNSRVVDLYRALGKFGITPLVCDPHADAARVAHEYGIALADDAALADVDALVLAVAHADFLTRPVEALTARIRPNGLIVDIAAALDPASIRADLSYWAL